MQQHDDAHREEVHEEMRFECGQAGEVDEEARKALDGEDIVQLVPLVLSQGVGWGAISVQNKQEVEEKRISTKSPFHQLS